MSDTPTTFEISYGDLADMLNTVVPFTSKDKMLPVLCAVHLEHRGGYLVAEATDRFTAGICRRDRVGTEQPLDLLLDVADIKHVMAALKPAKRDYGHVVVTVTVDHPNVEFRSSMGASITVRAIDGQFPNLGRVIQSALDKDDATGSFVVDPRKLAQFSKLGRTMRCTVKAGSQAMVVVEVDDHFIGCLMGVRDVMEKPIWTDVLAA